MPPGHEPDLRTLDSGAPPLSLAQRQLQYLCRLHSPELDIRLIAALRLIGDLQVAALVDAAREFRARHEVLRGDGRGGREAPAAPIRLLRVRASTPERFDLYVQGQISRLCDRPVDAALREPLDMTLFQATATHHVLLLTVSHHVADGVALGVLVRELSELYRARTGTGVPPSRAPDARQQVLAEHRRAAEGREANEAFWSAHLADCPPVLQLATVPGTAGGDVVHEVGTEVVRAVARQRRCSAFVAVLTAFAAELFDHTEQDVIAVQVPVDLREAGTPPPVGMFAVQLPMVVRRSWFRAGNDATRMVRNTLMDVVAHRHVGPAWLLSRTTAARRRAGFLDAMSVLITDLDHRDIEADHLDAGLRAQRFPLGAPSEGWAGGLLLSTIRLAGDVRLRLEYSAAVSRELAVQLLAGTAGRLAAQRFESAPSPGTRMVRTAAGDRLYAIDPAGAAAVIATHPRVASVTVRPPAAGRAAPVLEVAASPGIREADLVRWLAARARRPVWRPQVEIVGAPAARPARSGAVPGPLTGMAPGDDFWAVGGTVREVERLAAAFPGSRVARGDWRAFAGTALAEDIVAALTRGGAG